MRALVVAGVAAYCVLAWSLVFTAAGGAHDWLTARIDAQATRQAAAEQVQQPVSH